ncbi:Small subunit of serine palmitoyltransferase A [Myotis davidii]|uniref:Small subunit of serine palmitoyltransferase A n=1 Tax=Myotis davidii TaxID=225400 RepID=L5LV69_MYODS|nr:Small subunit of serine palmitoyltransferase A [Myotis davidii]
MALARAWKQMSWFYYQYLLVTALYMLEPWERTVFSILLGPRVRGPGRERGGPGGILPGPGPGGGGIGGRRGGAEGEEVVRGARSARKDWSLYCGREGRRSGARAALPVGAGVGERELLRSEVEASLSLEEIP